MGNETTAIQRRPESLPAQSEPFLPQSLEQAYRLAEDLAQSNLVPKHLQGKPYDAYVTLMWGRELGLSPMQSVLGIYVETRSGRPGLYEQTAMALVKRSPLCKYFQLVESSDELATFETQRSGNPQPTRMTYTIAQAAKAGLTTKDTWKSHPAAMLRARAAMHLARAVYEDVLANVYTPDELVEIRDREVIDIQVTAPPPPAPPAANEQKRAPASVPAASPRGPAPGDAVRTEAPKPAGRKAPCGSCGRAPSAHAAGRIDATCDLPSTTKAPAAAADKVIDITEQFLDDAKEKTIDDVGPKTAAKPPLDAPCMKCGQPIDKHPGRRIDRDCALAPPAAAAEPPKPTPAPAAPAADPDEIIAEFYRAAKSAVEVGKDKARAALVAVAAKIPPLVKAGAITADQRKMLEDEFAFARRVINEDLDFADAFALRETWGK